MTGSDHVHSILAVQRATAVRVVDAGRRRLERALHDGHEMRVRKLWTHFRATHHELAPIRIVVIPFTRSGIVRAQVPPTACKGSPGGAFGRNECNQVGKEWYEKHQQQRRSRRSWGQETRFARLHGPLRSLTDERTDRILSPYTTWVHRMRIPSANRVYLSTPAICFKPDP